MLTQWLALEQVRNSIKRQTDQNRKLETRSSDSQMIETNIGLGASTVTIHQLRSILGGRIERFLPIEEVISRLLVSNCVRRIKKFDLTRGYNVHVRWMDQKVYDFVLMPIRCLTIE